MVGAEKFPREIHDDGLALARREAHIGDPAPAALRVLHLEIREDDARLPSLGEGQVDARVRREDPRSEEHTSELQSLAYLVCRLLLEKKKTNITKKYLGCKQKRSMLLVS